MERYVAILGTLDTKGAEVDFLRTVVLSEGGNPLVLDTGVLNRPNVKADVTREQIAEAAGTSIREIIDIGDKSHALLKMAEGATAILTGILKSGKLGGVLAIGGSRGTGLSSMVMQAFPIGIPKLIVSTMASGRNTFGCYVGTKDITMMHSVADIMGINTITRPIFTNAAAAITAMARISAPIEQGNRPLLTASMLGVTTTVVGQIQQLMKTECEVVAFHAVGTGGRVMEELIESGMVEGVFEITPGEMTAEIVNSAFTAGPERMKAAARRGIPQVIAPAGVEFIIEGPEDRLPERYRGRNTMVHTPSITLVRTSAEEMKLVASSIAQRVNASNGPVAAIIPLRGFGWFSMHGEPLHEPESDRAFIDTFNDKAARKITIVELDTHINDPIVGKTAVRLMREMLRS
jgi:uncharacterized protein (UPF0261 family)